MKQDKGCAVEAVTCKRLEPKVGQEMCRDMLNSRTQTDLCLGSVILGIRRDAVKTCRGDAAQDARPIRKHDAPSTDMLKHPLKDG